MASCFVWREVVLKFQSGSDAADCPSLKVRVMLHFCASSFRALWGSLELRLENDFSGF
jgi:hypothetical protein